MTNLVKRDSLLKNLFDNEFFNPGNSNFFLVPSGIAVDITDDGDHYTVKADLPDFDSKNVDIEMNENVLTIKGSINEEKKEEAPNYLLQERKKNSFCRSFSFREAIVNEKTKASFVNGVLTIHLPKQEPEKPKKVKIDIA